MKKILITLSLAMAAMIAIPTAATAQDTTPEQKKECSKENKDCSKENCKKEDCKKEDCKKEDCKKEDCKDCKDCKKDGCKACKKAECNDCKKAECNDCKKQCDKPCMKDGKGKKGKRALSGQEMRGDDRKMKGHRGGENPLFKGITLSEEQKSKMKALREKNMNTENKTKEKSKEEMQKLRAMFDKEVEKILDKDQLKQYQANKAEMEAKRAQKKNK